MSQSSSRSDLAFLEQCQIAFQNATQNPVIKEELETVGYDSAKMAEGQALYDTATSKYAVHEKTENNKKVAYQIYSDKEAELKKLYSTHRKRAKIEFGDQQTILIQLDLTTATPTKYVEWLKVVKVFYSEALASPEIQTGLATLKVTVEVLTNTQALISPMETSYADYKNAVGIAEEDTKEKNDAFSTLDNWMRKFYKVAAIALEDNPQLLESLGKHVKS